MAAPWRKWLAFGSGLGIEISGGDLKLVAARVRPGGARILGSAVIPGFSERPAAEWGAEYDAFLRRHGVGYVAATVLLPRREVLLRQVQLPGVGKQQLDAAVGFQLESLHPYPEEDAVAAWTRLPGTDSVLVAIARREAIERYAALFAEAGIKVASFTFSAAALYTAARLTGDVPAGCLAVWDSAQGVEVYGESPARPLFSAVFETGLERAAGLAKSELRLAPETEVWEPARLLPAPKTQPQDFDLSRAALPYATALAGACPRLALDANLLPAGQRQTSSRAMYAPTAALAGVLAALMAAVFVYGAWEDARYLKALETEIARLEAQARKVQSMDRETATALGRVRLLDSFRLRTKADLDALNELTRLLEPPAWLNGLELTRTAVNLGGEAEQAAGLLKIIDSSPQFAGSEFTMPITRVGGAESFRIRASREGTP